jgi:hypothetical protein
MCIGTLFVKNSHHSNMVNPDILDSNNCRDDFSLSKSHLMKVTYTDKSGKKVEQTFGTEDEGKKLKENSKHRALKTQNGSGRAPRLNAW